jgi:hypothetical protein
MSSKRIFWLALAAAVGCLIWLRLRQRQEEFAAATPQFAAPRTFEPAAQPPPTPQAASEPAPPAAAEAAARSEAAAPVEDSEAGATAQDEISGYCMRCKTKRPIQNPRHETTESGRPAARGTCPVCGANMFTFLATNNDE